MPLFYFAFEIGAEIASIAVLVPLAIRYTMITRVTPTSESVNEADFVEAGKVSDADATDLSAVHWTPHSWCRAAVALSSAAIYLSN